MSERTSRNFLLTMLGVRWILICDTSLKLVVENTTNFKGRILFILIQIKRMRPHIFADLSSCMAIFIKILTYKKAYWTRLVGVMQLVQSVLRSIHHPSPYLVGGFLSMQSGIIPK